MSRAQLALVVALHLASTAAATVVCPDCDRVSCSDCDGRDCNGYWKWIADGVCDDGAQPPGVVTFFNFNCAAFEFDGGDCEEPTSAAQFACTDCSGRNCTGQEGRHGDGFCDAWFDTNLELRGV